MIQYEHYPRGHPSPTKDNDHESDSDEHCGKCEELSATSSLKTLERLKT